VLEPMAPVLEPEVPPEAEPDALPLMPPVEAPGVELLLELLGESVAPGAELELLLELPGAVLVPGLTVTELLELDGSRGAVLEPVLLLDDEAPGRVVSLVFGADGWSRLQPATASAIVTAAAMRVRWVSLCICNSPLRGVGD
jgi:hypothetical protein